MRLSKLTSAHVIALVALFVALAGSAGAAAVAFITGADVVDHSLSGRDVARHSLGGKTLQRGSVGTDAVRNGSLRAGDFDQSRLPGLTKKTVKAPPIAGYTDLDPLVGYRPRRGGDYLVITRFRVRNTGGSDEYLNCAYQANGQLFPTAGAQTTAGQATTAYAVTAVEIPSSNRIDFACLGGGATTYDISKIRMRVLTLW